MKFLSRLGIFLIVLVLVYGGLLWKIGQDAEKRLVLVHQKAEEIYPFLSVVDRQYERGIFSSKETLSWAFKVPDYGLNGGMRKTPVIKTETVVKHGPFPGFCLALATTDTQVFAHDPSIRQFFNTFFKGNAPLRITTKVPLIGSVVAKIHSPELKIELVPGEGVNWQGANVDLLLDKNFASYSYGMKMPGFTVESRSEHVGFSGLEFKGKGTRVFEEFPYFYVGKDQGGIDVVRFYTSRKGPAFELVDFGFDTDSGVSDGLLQLNLKMKAAELNFAEVGLTNLALDFGCQGLDARALAEFQKTLLDFNYEEIEKALEDPKAEWLGKMRALFPASSSMQLRDFSMSNRGGDIRTSGSFDLGSLGNFFQVAMAEQTGSVPEKDELDAALALLSGDFFVEASRDSLLVLIEEVGGENFGSVKEAQSFVGDVLDAFVGNGLVENDHGVLRTKVLVREGIVSMNGVAVDSATFDRILGTDDHDDIDGFDMEEE